MATIIDFKTSRKLKKEEWIEDYFLQCTAYSIMFEELTGNPINQIVILVVTENGTVQEFIKDKREYIPLSEKIIEEWYETCK